MKLLWKPKLIQLTEQKTRLSGSTVMTLPPYYKLVGIQQGGERPDAIELDHKDLKEILNREPDKIIHFLLTLVTCLKYQNENSTNQS